MSGFDAGSVVEPLEYKFSAFIPGCDGVIKEPTDEQIIAFFSALRSSQAETRRQSEAAAEKAEKAAAETGRESAGIADADDKRMVEELNQRMAGIHSDLCSGTPTAEQLLKLPMRIRGRFYTWLQTEVTNPEAAPGGGRTQG